MGLVRSWLIVVLCFGCKNAPHAIDDGRPARSCPTHMDFELFASESRFDAGYGGLGHGIKMVDGSRFTVEITQCDDDCRRCRFQGPVASDQPVKSQRCLTNIAIPCTSNADCPGNSDCRFMFPPLSHSVLGAVDTCSVAFF